MKEKFLTGFAIVAILTILSIAIMPVETSWCWADLTFAYIVSVMVLFSILYSTIVKLQYRFSLIDGLIFIWYFYVNVYAYIIPAYPVASVILKATMCLSLYIALRFILYNYEYREDTIAVILILICFAETMIGLYQIATGDSRNNTQAVTGTFGNSGPFGIMLSCGIVQLISFTRKYSEAIRRDSGKKVLSYIIGVSMLLMLLITLSRAAILALIIFLLYTFRKKAKQNIVVTGICVLVILVFLYIIKFGSANGRAIIWWVSLHSIKDHLFVGTGLGSFFNQYAKELALLSSNAKDGRFNNMSVVNYAFNTFVHIGVEQGLIGLIIASFIVVIITKKIYEAHSINSCVIFVLAVSSMFSYTLELLPFQIMSVVILASLFSDNLKRNDKGKPSRSILLLGFLLTLCFTSLTHVKQRVEANYKYAQFKGIHTADYIQDYYDIYQFMLGNPNFLFDFAKVLANSRRYNDSNTILQKGQLISADPMFFVLQGSNLEHMNEMKLAEDYYKKGFLVMPNRLYPLHKVDAIV